MTTGIQGRKSSMFFASPRSDYLTLANLGSGVANLSPASDEPFSISGWYFTEESSPSYTIMSNRQSSVNAGYWFGLQSGRGSFSIRHGSTTTLIQSPGREDAYYSGPWIHQVITYDGGGNASGLTLYVNGAFTVAGTSVTLGSTTNTTDPIRIADGYGASAYGMKGSISNVSFWDKELTPAEIDHILHGNNGGRGPGDLNYHPSFSNCVGWWLADHADDDSTKIYDASSNNNNFTITGSPVLRKISP